MTIETPIRGKVMLCQTLSSISSVAQPIDQELILFSHQFMFKQKILSLLKDFIANVPGIIFEFDGKHIYNYSYKEFQTEKLILEIKSY